MGIRIHTILKSLLFLNSFPRIYGQFGLLGTGQICTSGLQCSSMDCHSGLCRGTVFGRADFLMESFEYSVDFVDKLHVVGQSKLVGTVKTLDYIDQPRKGLSIIALGRRNLCENVASGGVRTAPLYTDSIASFFDNNDGEFTSGSCNSFTDAYFDDSVQNTNTWGSVFDTFDNIDTRHNRTNPLASEGFSVIEEASSSAFQRSYTTSVNIGALSKTCGVFATQGAQNLPIDTTEDEKNRYLNYHLYKSVVTLFKANPRDSDSVVFGMQCISQEYSLDVAAQTSQVAAFAASIDTQAVVEGVEYKDCSSILTGSCEIAHCEQCNPLWGPQHSCANTQHQFQLEVTLKVDKPNGTTVVGISSEEYGQARNCFGFGNDHVIIDSDTTEFATVKIRTACLDLTTVGYDNGGSGYGIDCDTFNTCGRSDLGINAANTNYGFMLNLSRTDSGMHQNMFVDLTLDSFTCPSHLLINDDVIELNSNIELWAGQGKTGDVFDPAVRRATAEFNEAEEIIFALSLNGTLYQQSMFNLMMKTLITCRLSSHVTLQQKNCILNGGDDCLPFNTTSSGLAIKGCAPDAIGRWEQWKIDNENSAGPTLYVPIETSYVLVGHKNSAGENQYGIAADLSTFGFSSSRCKTSTNWWTDTSYQPTDACSTDVCHWKVGEEALSAENSLYTNEGFQNAMDAFRVESSIFAIANEQANWIVEIEAEVENCHTPANRRRLLRLVREVPVSTRRHLLQVDETAGSFASQDSLFTVKTSTGDSTTASSYVTPHTHAPTPTPDSDDTVHDDTVRVGFVILCIFIVIFIFQSYVTKVPERRNFRRPCAKFERLSIIKECNEEICEHEDGLEMLYMITPVGKGKIQRF